MMSQFLESDVACFVALAKEEGWITGNWELDFLRRAFPEGCLVWRESGKTLGYITSIKHENSGWIGNLLVTKEARGQGVGSRLMQGALDALIKKETATIWLTASPKGLGIYRKLGFVTIDSVTRWEGEGKADSGLLASAAFEYEVIRQVDRAGWGDRRRALLEITCSRGRTYSGKHSFLCCQPWEEGTQLGPWGSLSASEAEPLLDLALADCSGRVFLDVPAANLTAAGLLARRGFTICGHNTLMYLGAPPGFDAGKVFALASMGSMG